MSPPPTTDEQLSGRAARAVAGMDDDLARRLTGLNSADVQLAEALLNAHAASELGRQRLEEIQQQLIDAINNPFSALDTPTGQRQFLIFLRSKVAEIQQILADGSLSADKQAELAQAVADTYVTDMPGSAETLSAPVAPASGLVSALPAALGAIPQAAGGAGQPAGAALPTAAAPLGALPGALSYLLADAPPADRAEQPEDPRDEPDPDPDTTDHPVRPEGEDDRGGAPPEVDGPAPTGPAGGEE